MTEKGTAEATLATQSLRVSRFDRLVGLKRRESRVTCLEFMEKTMRISDNEVKKLLSTPSTEVEAIVEFADEVYDPAADQDLLRKVKSDVMAMPDREEMVADLKARIEAGTYNPTGDEIADTMIRRAIADRIRG